MNRIFRFLLIVFVLLAAIPLNAQAPYKFSYQAVVRDNNNKLIRNSTVGLRISILKTSSTGTVLFQETHNPLTNDNGLFSVVIGGGSLVSGSIASIDWGSDIFFLKSEIDPLGLTNYTLVSTQQLVSVPYALHCNEYQSLEDVVKRNNFAGSRQLKDVKDPTDPQDAVTKYYLDSVLQNLAIVMSQPNRDTNATACDLFVWRGKTYKSSGRYSHTIKNAGCGGSCDSIINLYLTILRGSHYHYYDTACTDSYTWLANGAKGHGSGSEYTSAGKYAGAEYTNEDNCSSFDTLHLAFGTESFGNDAQTACDKIVWHGTTYSDVADDGVVVYDPTDKPTFRFSKVNASGCDSVVTLNLTLKHSTTGIFNAVACDSYTWSEGNGSTYTTSLTTADAVRVTKPKANQYGCDSTATLVLTINHNNGVTDNRAICSGSSLMWYGNSYSTAITDGSVKHQFSDANGCLGDSVLHLTLQSQPSVSLGDIVSSLSTTFCQGTTTTLTGSVTSSDAESITYAWTAENGGIASPDNLVTEATPTAATTYTLTATAHREGCTDATDSKSISVTLTPAPTVALADIDGQSICSGSNATLSAVVTPSDGVTYVWKQGETVIVTNSSVQVAPSSTTSYTVTASKSENGCTGTASKTVTVTVESPSLTLGNILAGGTASTTIEVDKDASLTLAANVTSSSSGSLSYAWSTSAAGGTDIGTNSSISANTSTAGSSITYYLRVTNTSSASCSTYQDKSITVTVKDACNLEITKLSVDKIGSTYTNYPAALKATYTVSDPTAELTWNWYKTNSSGTINSGTSTFVSSNSYQHCYFVTTSTSTEYYMCELTATKGSCTVTKKSSTAISTGNKGWTGTTDFSVSVAKSGSTLTTTATNIEKGRKLCTSYVPTVNTQCLTPTDKSTIWVGSSSASANGATLSTSCTFSNPPAGTSVKVYCWITNGSSCTSISTSSYANHKIKIIETSF